MAEVSLDIINDKSTLVQEMALCRQARVRNEYIGMSSSLKSVRLTLPVCHTSHSHNARVV